ncbi:Tumor protein p63-regulated 1-like protein [Schistosoma japonicum]|uniref:Tumor protein p63-regulated 1-like protein n=2 Tax=Schistosoma japonicum TaxID=6182 RepID=C1LEU4_SCHJA|nr:Tumor protein p63-regulated 1-like protein [Schistosoma japonicum]CAX73222.1 hypothetical protein [Schistosoma japonicum]
MNTSEQTIDRPFVTVDGKIWPANVFVPCKRYYCIKYTKEMLVSKIKEKCLKPDDGNFVDLWVLTRINHWDHEIETTVCLTDEYLMLISFNFINENYTVKRVPLQFIKTMRIGNVIQPNWSALPQRNYGGVQLIWGALDQIKWIDRWNPISQDVPMVILHHHPCFYSIEPIPDKDMYNCDLAISAISKALSTHGVQVEYANIHLNSHVNFFTIIYNQSNLGFCKDRNGVSF